MTPAQRRRLLRWFLLGLSATRVAQETRLGREQVALGGLLLVHQAMVRDVPPALSGVVEIDETSLAGAWRNKRRAARAQGTKRGRGTTKRAVFGILCRGGQVWAAVVPNVEEKTLLLSSTTACNSTPSSARTPSPATLGLQRGATSTGWWTTARCSATGTGATSTGWRGSGVTSNAAWRPKEAPAIHGNDAQGLQSVCIGMMMAFKRSGQLRMRVATISSLSIFGIFTPAAPFTFKVIPSRSRYR